MVTKVHFYVTKDDKQFSSEEAAIAHERAKCTDWVNEVLSWYADKYDPDALGYWAIDPDEDSLTNNLYYGTFEKAVARVAEDMWTKRLNITVYWFPKLCKE